MPLPMTKKFIQDVIVSKRPIRETLPLPSRAPDLPKPVPEPTDTEAFLPKLIEKPRRSPPSLSVPPPGGGAHTGSSRVVSKRRFVAPIVVALIVFSLLGALILSVFFARATITVEPFEEFVALDHTFTAREGPADDAPLLFQKIGLPNEERTEEIPAVGEERVLRKASGTIRIFNEYNPASQRLVRNTRFEGANGKIYRINSSVVVPGMTTDASGKKIPGSIDATVYADAPSEEYNASLTDFSIPGFKGDPRYGKFYARSVTPITGGFSGTVHVPDPNEAAAAKERLRNALRDELITKARAQIPEHFILFDGAAFISFNDDLDPGVSASPTTITVRGSLVGVMFDRKALSSAIAAVAPSSEKIPVLIRNLDTLSFAFKDPALSPERLATIEFSVSGNAHMVGDIDYADLAKNLAMIENRSRFNDVIQRYAGIRRAEAKIMPVWRRTFPKDPADIAIVEKLSVVNPRAVSQ